MKTPVGLARTRYVKRRRKRCPLCGKPNEHYRPCLSCKKK